jgi:flavorubredoxin
MYCTRKITDDITWVGADDRRVALFEGVYSIPKGVSYNSYIIMDEKTVLLDTVDKAVSDVFMENVEHTLGGRELDYLVVHHMEPDHSSTMMSVLKSHPETKLVCNKKILDMVKQFFDVDLQERTILVSEGDELSFGKHSLKFVNAPFVHWPEVMVSFDPSTGILFSADAFGTFGALNGAIFADEVNFQQDYMDEARRYYTNIVGKYGQQVQALLKKASSLDIKMICPLHGPVWRKDLGVFIEKYDKWSSYTPEETGVVIAYASIYGNTANAANILACKLQDMGVKTTMFVTSVISASEIIAACFKYSHIVFASSTYNGGIFVTMENLLNDLVAHNLQKRTIALMQNGTWAPTTVNQMKKLLEGLKNNTMIESAVSLKSSLKETQLAEIEALAGAIKETIA